MADGGRGIGDRRSNFRCLCLLLCSSFTPSSELVTETDAGIVVGRPVGARSAKGSTGVGNGGTDEAVGEAALDLRVHDAGVHVDVPGEAPVNHHRDCIQCAGATRGDRGSSAVGKWVRSIAVVKAV